MLDGQTLVALGCVGIAAVWLVVQAWRGWRGTGSTGCGSGCQSCPQNAAKAATPSAGFVALDDLTTGSGARSRS